MIDPHEIIETLEYAKRVIGDKNEVLMKPIDKSIKELRQALAQPEQEPVAWMNNDYEVFFDAGKAACYSMGWVKPLYTAPPKREWVGLTDEERQEIVRQEVHWSGICRVIEAKLKEKNT